MNFQGIHASEQIIRLLKRINPEHFAKTTVERDPVCQISASDSANTNK